MAPSPSLFFTGGAWAESRVQVLDYDVFDYDVFASASLPPLFREIKNVRPKYETCCLTFGIFEYEAMDEDLDENGEICFNYCRLLRNISLECRKGDCFQHIMLNPPRTRSPS
eukprot:tig00000248_g21837.t1